MRTCEVSSEYRAHNLLDLEGHGGKRICGMSRVSTYVIF
jgi:hypothetical protein